MAFWLLPLVLVSLCPHPHSHLQTALAGSLLTLFLSGPLMAFCLAAGNTEPSVQQLVDLQVCLRA